MIKMTKEHYDKKYDILGMHWGGEVNESIELFDGQLVLDLDKKLNVVGMEIFNFMEEVRKHNKKIEKIFKNARKKK